MRLNQLIGLLFFTVAATGCNKSGTTSSPAATSNAPLGGVPIVRPGTDLSAYGIPGIIDLPGQFQITQQAPAQVAIDREDDPFDLRIIPLTPIEPTLADRRNALKETKDDPWEFLVDEADGFAAWQRSPTGRHHIEVCREVVLGKQKFHACCIIVDERASKELAHRVWQAAKSLREK